jgi:hypothetical protein
MITAISEEYGDEQMQYFVETVENLTRQIYPSEEKAAVPVSAEDDQRLQIVLNEMEKNIEESISYYMSMLGDLMELISSRALEIQKSIESYDTDFNKWLQANTQGIQHPRIQAELKKWEDAKNLINVKLKALTE